MTDDLQERLGQTLGERGACSMLTMWTSAKKTERADERRASSQVAQPGRQGEAAEEELLADGDDEGRGERHDRRRRGRSPRAAGPAGASDAQEQAHDARRDEQRRRSPAASPATAVPTLRSDLADGPRPRHVGQPICGQVSAPVRTANSHTTSSVAGCLHHADAEEVEGSLGVDVEDRQRAPDRPATWRRSRRRRRAAAPGPR